MTLSALAPAAALTLSPDVRPRCLRLLVNHRSGRNAKDPKQRAALVSAFDGLGEVAQTEDEEGLSTVLHRWKAEGVDLLAISGGDGTMQRALVGLRAIWGPEPLPSLLLLHGGTSGLVPRSAGVRSSVQAVGRLREAMQGGRPLDVQPFPTLLIGDRPAFTVGLGAFHRVALQYVERGRRGEADHVRIGLRLFGSWLAGGGFSRRMLEPLPFVVRLGDREFAAGDLMGVHISALDHFLLHTYRRIARDAVGLRVVALAPMDRWTMLRGFVPLGAGRFPLPRAMAVTAVPTVTLEATEGPIEYMADGEFYADEGPLTIGPGIVLSVVRTSGPDRRIDAPKPG